jgi:hypothetical protein
MSFSNIDLLNSHYVKIVDDGGVRIVEESKDGAGTCYFQTNSPTLLIKAKDQSPVVWSLKNQKCAEGAFVVRRADQSLELHIVEMKSSLTHKEFLKVLEQWRGMYLSALATLGVIQTEAPTKVVAYVAYKKQSVEDPDPTQLIMMKTQVGGGLMPGKHEWAAEEVVLHHGVVASIVKKARVGTDCDFGNV